MDIITLAFKQLQYENKAEVIFGFPCCEWGELLDRMVTIRNWVTASREKCDECGKQTFDIIRDECVKCNPQKGIKDVG